MTFSLSEDFLLADFPKFFFGIFAEAFVGIYHAVLLVDSFRRFVQTFTPRAFLGICAGNCSGILDVPEYLAPGVLFEFFLYLNLKFCRKKARKDKLKVSLQKLTRQRFRISGRFRRDE